MNEEEEELHIGHGELKPGQKWCKSFGSFVWCDKQGCTGCTFTRRQEDKK